VHEICPPFFAAKTFSSAKDGIMAIPAAPPATDLIKFRLDGNLEDCITVY
jgi:hypothetical protein